MELWNSEARSLYVWSWREHVITVRVPVKSNKFTPNIQDLFIIFPLANNWKNPCDYFLQYLNLTQILVLEYFKMKIAGLRFLRVVYYDLATLGLQKQRFTMGLNWFQNVEERISILSTSQRMWNQWLLVQLGPRSSTEDRSVRPALVCTFLSQCGPKSNRKC